MHQAMTRENNYFIAVDLCMQNSRAGPIIIFEGVKVSDLQYLLISLEECLV